MSDSAVHILLTGGTGFFGLSLLRHFQTLGPNAPTLTVLSRDPQRFRARHPDLYSLAHWVRGDVQIPESLPRGMRFSHVLHAAADSTLGPSLSALERYRQIIDGTRHVLDLALESGACRLLLTSSGGVYGPVPPGMSKIPEDHHGMPDPLRPDNAYSVAKRTAEHLCSLYQDAHGLDFVIARCFSFVGQDLPLGVHFAVGNFIRDALERDEISVASDGTAVRSYMDQRDLAQWLFTLLEKGRAGQAYNVGSDTPITVAELAHRVRDVLAPGKKVRISGTALASNWRNHYVPSIDKARSELGLDLRHGLDDSLKQFIHPQRSN